MRLPIRTIAFIVIVPAWATAFAECGPGLNYGELRDCVASEVTTSDRELNLAYKQLRQTIATQTAEGSDVSRKDLDVALIRSQRAWLEFREAECQYDLEMFVGGTGTLAALAANRCLVSLNVARAAALRKKLSALAAK